MCESNAYMKTTDGEKMVMENVVTLKVGPGKIYLSGLLGDEITVDGEIEEINLMGHKIILSESQN